MRGVCVCSMYVCVYTHIHESFLFTHTVFYCRYACTFVPLCVYTPTYHICTTSVRESHMCAHIARLQSIVNVYMAHVCMCTCMYVCMYVCIMSIHTRCIHAKICVNTVSFMKSFSTSLQADKALHACLNTAFLMFVNRQSLCR